MIPFVGLKISSGVLSLIFTAFRILLKYKARGSCCSAIVLHNTSRSRAILSRSPESGSGQANAAGGGRGWSQKQAAPHGRPGSGIAHWLGQPGVCVDRACPGRRCCAPVAAPAVPPPPALSALHLARRKGYRLPVLFFPFCLTAAASGGFPPRDFPSHVTPPFSAVKSRGRPAGVAGD